MFNWIVSDDTVTAIIYLVGLGVMLAWVTHTIYVTHRKDKDVGR